MPQVSKYVRTLTKEQQLALKRVYDRGPVVVGKHPLSYRQFRRKVIQSYTMNCAMIEWCGMWLGIEMDGHTHS